MQTTRFPDKNTWNTLLQRPVMDTSALEKKVNDILQEVRTGGDQDASDKLYDGVNPMTGEDIASTLLWVAELPPHLNINALELMPVSQSFAGFQVAREK